MSTMFPEPTIQSRQAPTYDFDSAIKRRFESINAIGDDANAYTKMIADRRVAAQAQQMRSYSQGSEGFSYSGPGGNDLRSKLVQGVAAYKGTPYVWGGAAPGGFDCSGLIKYVYSKMGVKVPRVSQQQATMGKVTDVRALKAGDFVAWGSSPATATHIAVYAGNGMVWEAPHKGASVRLRPISPNERGIMGIALNI